MEMEIKPCLLHSLICCPSGRKCGRSRLCYCIHDQNMPFHSIPNPIAKFQIRLNTNAIALLIAQFHKSCTDMHDLSHNNTFFLSLLLHLPLLHRIPPICHRNLVKCRARPPSTHPPGLWTTKHLSLKRRRVGTISTHPPPTWIRTWVAGVIGRWHIRCLVRSLLVARRRSVNTRFRIDRCAPNTWSRSAGRDRRAEFLSRTTTSS